MEQQQGKTAEQHVLKTAISELAKAYTAAWGEISNVVKNSHNPHFQSDYADLGTVLDTVRGVFAKHGLALLQTPGKLTDVGGVAVVSLMGVLMHESGQSISMEMSIPLGPKSTAQAAGSAITYARRYQMAAVGGVAQVDDDGNSASAPAPAPAKRGPGRPPKAPAPQEKPADPEPEDGADDEDDEPEEKPAPKSKAKAGNREEEKDDLENRILKCKTIDDLEEMKQEVIDFNDEELGQAYILRRKTLKGKK